MVPSEHARLPTVPASCQEQANSSNTLSGVSLAPGVPRTDSGPRMGDLGVRLRWIRCSTAMDQAAFGNAVGISEQTIGALERGEREPYRSTVVLLAEFLEVPVDELVAFLAGTGALRTIPKPMRTWIDVPRVTSKTTLGELSKLAGGT